MPNRTVAQNYHYRQVRISMHEISALLIAVEKSGIEMDSGDVLAAIGGIQMLVMQVNDPLDKIGDMEVTNG